MTNKSVKKLTEEAGWLKKLFSDLYQVTLYFDEEDGTQSVRVFLMKDIKRLNNKMLKGVDWEGCKIEFITTKPFTYEKKKIY